MIRHLSSIVVALIPLLAAVILMSYVLRQVKKPTGRLGQLVLRSMNLSHSHLTDWGLKHVVIEKGFAILDVGCGGGRTIEKMAAVASEGHVVGIDYSIDCVEASRATNAREVAAGRVEVRQASVSQLPFDEATFDLVTAIETHYYWPDLPRDIREIHRVLKPGGSLLVIAEAYKGSRNFLVQKIAMAPLRATFLSADEHRDWFASAGFSDVRVSEDRAPGWICVTGRK